MGEWLRIDPEYQGLLREAGLADLEALLAGGGGRRIRHSLRTNAYRVELREPGGGHRTLYVKAHREPWPRLRYLFRRSRPAREWRVLQGLRERGIPAARPVAVGERRRRGLPLGAVLVTEEVPGSTDLVKFVQAPGARPHTRERLREKRRCIEALARFTRRMHEAGYLSRDFHWRNILIVPGSPEPRFFIIDNPRGLFLPWGRLACWLGVRDLTALDRLAPHYLTRTDRLRFLKAYVGAARLRECRRLLERVLSRRRRLGHRGTLGSRPRPTSGGPLRVAQEGSRWLVLRERAGPTLSDLRALEPAALLEGRLGGRVVARHSRGTTLQLPGPPGLRLKRTVGGGGLRGWLRGLRSRGLHYGPCGREWRNLRTLAALGLTAPRWLAFAQERRGGVAVREALLLEEVAGATPLLRWLTGGATLGQRRAFLRELGRQVARAHAGRFSFGDFPPGSIWVRPRPPGAVGEGGSPEVPEPVFVEVARGRAGRRLRRRDVVRDLSRLAGSLDGLLSRTDALRFFLAYLGRRPAGAEDKGLARAVLNRYQKLLKGRPTEAHPEAELRRQGRER